MAYPEPPTILVVSHQQTGRQRIAQILGQAGLRAVESAAESEAIATATAREDFQLIVSVDVLETEGRTLLRRPAAREEADPIPVYYLFFGAPNEMDPDEQTKETFNPTELVSNIRTLLRVRRAEEGARSRLRDMIHLHEIGTHLSKSLDLQPTLHEVLAAILELQRAPLGALLLYDAERRELTPAVSIGLSQEMLSKSTPLPLEGSASGRALAEHRSIAIEDLRADPLYTGTERLKAAEEAGYHSIFSVPLLTHKDEALGVITTCWTTPHRPSDWEVNLVELYARHAANAIENARLYLQLQEEDRHKDEFLAMLAHELRNPLAPILNAAHVMRLHAPSNDTLLWAIGMVERQTRHLTLLVGDLLDVSRITRGKIELHRELVTLRSLVQNVAESNRALMTERGHEFAVELPEETLWLDADPTRLEQILNNLLHNAAKYTPRGGRVAMSAGREKESPDFPYGAAVIRVRDSGIGIAPEMLRRVFEVFSQAERTLDRAEGGLGLGLTLVRRLTEMHGGTVEAHSDGLGRGSEFIVRLPLVPLRPETFEAPAHNDRQDEMDALFQGSRGHGRRVLVVDDQIDTAQSLAELLEIWGHEVRVGYDGPAAVELAEQYHPDVVLLDIGLPLMNGYEVARRLRQEQGGREMTIVAMTGYGQDEDRRRAMEAGFDLHMTKPVDLDALRDLVNSASAI